MGDHTKESELDKYEDRAYRQLKEKIYRTKRADGTFKCPFCIEKENQEYLYDDLLEHARRRGKGSINMDLKLQGQHLALASYLARYHDPRFPRAPSNKGDLHGQCGKGDAISSRFLHSSEKATHVGSEKGDLHGQGGNGDATLSIVLHSSVKEMHVGSDNSSKIPKSSGEEDPNVQHNKSKKFVYPWKGILVNVPVEFKDGRYVGESGKKLKEQLIEQGLNPEKVTPLWNFNGFSGCCMVDFIGNWLGYENAMRFEKAFEADHHGKMDWYKAKVRGDRLYGWMATEEDYQSNSLLRKYLKKCNLKSIEDIEAEDKGKTTKLVSFLTNSMQDKDLQSEMMKNKLQATSKAINRVMDETDAMTEAYDKEMNEMHRIEQKRTERMLKEHDGIKKKIESQKKQLKLREKELDKREVRNENEKRELLHQQKTNEIADEVQKQVHENLLRLAEEQKKEKDELHKKSMDLEKELARKQALELEVERMRGAVKIMEHMGDDDDVEVKKKLESIEEELEDKIEELESLEDLNQALIIKEHKASQEMQEALNALINGFHSGATKGARPNIGVKKLGELDSKPFQIAAKKKYSAQMAPLKATEWWSLWEEYMKDTTWHPFKHIAEKGTNKEVIDEEDERLGELKNEVGEEAYNAVVSVLLELNEYSPQDRTPRLELWNLKEQRRSNLYEGVTFLLNKWKLARKKK